MRPLMTGARPLASAARNSMLRPRQILNQMPRQEAWYRIVNKATADEAEIFLYDDIGMWGKTASDFMAELRDISAPQINLHLASLGGDVFDGIAIYNALRTHSARVVVQVDSMAASIASVIAQAGDERVMVSGAQMMIHEAWGLAIGSAEDMRQYADTLDRQTEIIADIYTERAEGGVRMKANFLKLMKAETWMNAEEAVAEKLADRVMIPAKQDTAPPSDDGPAEDDSAAEATAWAAEFAASMEIGMEIPA